MFPYASALTSIFFSDIPVFLCLSYVSSFWDIFMPWHSGKLVGIRGKNEIK